VSDDYVYLSLRNNIVISSVDLNKFHSSLRDRLVRFKRTTKVVNRVEMVKYSLALIL